MRLVLSAFAIAMGLGMVSCLPSQKASVKNRASGLGGDVEMVHRGRGTEGDVSPKSRLRLLVKGIRSMTVPSQLCYSVDDSNAIAKTAASKSDVTCVSLPSGKTSFELPISNVPKPAYIFVFHDENANSKLDFTVLDIVVERHEAIGEGYAFVEDPNSTSDDVKIRRIVILPDGDNQLETTLVYEKTAFAKFLEEKAWEQIMSKARAGGKK
jgi:hypothetical protein